MRIYTRTGDTGMTSRARGERIPKSDPGVEACGAIDELNAHLGAVLSVRPADETSEGLRRIQRELFSLGAALALPPAEAEPFSQPLAAGVVAMEAAIDRMDAALPPLHNFILPGGSPEAARVHIARSVCRRAERRLVAHAGADPARHPLITYLNRLSDYLFVVARFENLRLGKTEEIWKPED